MNPLLELKNLTITFHTPFATIPAVKGIGFELFEGETLALVGESGCGKSATALGIMGLLPKEKSTLSGTLLFRGRSLPTLSERSYQGIRGREIGMVFQDPMTSLNPLMKIGRQITETIRRHRRIGKADAKRKACELLERVGIAEPERRYNQYPYEFSGGMRQRVMIAQALACEPHLLIVDEPTTALDVTIQAQILELLKSLQKEMNTSILLITHDLGVVAQVADRMVVMYAGQIVEQGKTEELFARPTHPYTQGLLDSVPGRFKPEELLVTIPGSPPNLSQPTVGCPFSPRCPHAMEICTKRQPPLYETGVERLSACWRHHPSAQKLYQSQKIIT